MDLSRIMGVLGHELRTPLAAILGYYELLAEGIYGDIDEKQREAVQRIGQSAHQLLALIEGIQELATGNTAEEEAVEPFDAVATLRSVHDRLGSYAASRDVIVELEAPATSSVNGIESRFTRIFDMVLGAAIKTSNGSTIRARLESGPARLRLVIDGTGLDLQRDNPAQVRNIENGKSGLTGAALRLAIAEESARLAGGHLKLIGESSHVCVTVELPTDASVISGD